MELVDLWLLLLLAKLPFEAVKGAEVKPKLVVECLVVWGYGYIGIFEQFKFVSCRCDYNYAVDELLFTYLSVAFDAPFFFFVRGFEFFLVVV